MFKLRKEEGYNKAISVYNPDSKKSVSIGTMNTNVVDTLEKAGMTIGGSGLSYTGRWDVSISEELGRTLAELALKMSKPPKVKKDKPAVEKSNSEIDAWDVLLGLASYKKGE